METNTVSNRMYAIVVLYDMHTGFFAKAIQGISDEDAQNRLNTKANHIAWLTGSLVHQRYTLAKELGIEQETITEELFKDNKGIQDGVTYPTLADLKKEWDHLTPEVRKALQDTTDEQLDKQIDMEGMTMSVYDLIVFTIYREASIIGQVALWRRLLGHKGMDYM